MIIKDLKPFTKNTLRAFFTIEFPNGLIIHDCMLHESNGRKWIGLPAKLYKTKDGEDTWKPIVEIRKDRQEAFQNKVLTLLGDILCPPST